MIEEAEQVLRQAKFNEEERQQDRDWFGHHQQVGVVRQAGSWSGERRIEWYAWGRKRGRVERNGNWQSMEKENEMGRGT